MAFIPPLIPAVGAAFSAFAGFGAWASNKMMDLSSKLAVLEQKENEGHSYLQDLLRPLAESTERAIKASAPHIKMVSIAITAALIVSTTAFAGLTLEIRALRRLLANLAREQEEFRDEMRARPDAREPRRRVAACEMHGSAWL